MSGVSTDGMPYDHVLHTHLCGFPFPGKIFALLGVLQALSPLISSTLYVAIYTRTLNTEPGIFNVFSAFLFGIGIILLG